MHSSLQTPQEVGVDGYLFTFSSVGDAALVQVTQLHGAELTV